MMIDNIFEGGRSQLFYTI